MLWGFGWNFLGIMRVFNVIKSVFVKDVRNGSVIGDRKKKVMIGSI